jgi:hypothetical protein
MADLLQCSVRQIWRLRESGSIPPPIQAGRWIRWSRAVVDRWLEQGELALTPVGAESGTPPRYHRGDVERLARQKRQAQAAGA